MNLRGSNQSSKDKHKQTKAGEAKLTSKHGEEIHQILYNKDYHDIYMCIYTYVHIHLSSRSLRDESLVDENEYTSGTFLDA